LSEVPVYVAVFLQGDESAGLQLQPINSLFPSTRNEYQNDLIYTNNFHIKDRLHVNQEDT
jgi:hypothetical protein